jgi:KR domain
VSKLAPDVGFVALFGSVSGVFGNKGQVDYAAANDALDALATGAVDTLLGRVIAIDWGPWGRVGMVSDELARAYARRGIGTIDPEDGVAALLEELAYRYEHGTFAAKQVVYARADLSAFSSARGDEVGGT